MCVVSTEAEDTGPVYGSVGQFDRTKAAGLLKVVHLTSRTDLYALYPFPPAEVRDLRVNATSYEEKTVTLEWTAVGDYADEETGKDEDQQNIKYSVFNISNKMNKINKTEPLFIYANMRAKHIYLNTILLCMHACVCIIITCVPKYVHDLLCAVSTANPCPPAYVHV